MAGDEVVGDGVTESARTWRPGAACRRVVAAPAARGFTLLEMLVALAIVAVGLATVVLSLKPDPRRMLALEAERLALLLDQAREESRLSGTPLAWQWRPDGYVFLRRELTDNGASWLAMTEDEIFRPRALPDGARIERVEADGLSVALGDRVALYGDGAQRLELDLSLEDARARITSADGRSGDSLRIEARGG